MLRNAIPAFPVRDVAAAVACYEGRSGLTGVPVRGGAESFIAGTASCRIEVADVDGLFAQLRDVLHPTSRGGVSDTDLGTREFATVDADGNLLSFFRLVA